MSDFTLEIYGEEIPSSAQSLIEKSVQSSLEGLFKDLVIEFDKINTYSTARRVVINVENLSSYTSLINNEIRGPRVDSNENAINGFLKSNGIKNIKKLNKKEINGKLYFIFIKKSKAKKVSVILQNKLPGILRSIKWLKSMRWGSNSDRWIRPIKNIMCVFNGKIIRFEFAGKNSNNYTFGNYNLSEKKIKYSFFKKFKKELHKNRVILDRNERKNFIINQLEKYCSENSLAADFNESLVGRVSNSVEYPNTFFGSFSSDYFELPEFLIENILSDKQDYFSFRDKEKKLTNKFCFVSNLDSKHKKNLIKGNQNVLKARFSDAKFFIEEDKKKKLSERNKELKDIIFYENTGTLFDRSERIKELVNYLYKTLERKLGENYDYLMLSNADLSTELVKEFPNLQGKVGGFLASQEDLPSEICSAISDQYDYEFSSKYNNFLTFIFSISQKFDGIVGYFISKKKLTGSGDPFGVRRSTLSIIKICVEKKIHINFLDLFNHLKKIYTNQNIEISLRYEFIDDFFTKRLLILFTELGYRQDIIKASFVGNGINPYSVYIRVLKLSKLVKTKDGNDFLKSFKRIDSFTDNSNNEDFNQNIFIEKEEFDLNDLLSEIKKKYLVEEDFMFQDFKLMKRITNVLNGFCDNVTVNVDDQKIKKNRKALISKFYKIMDDLYNFSILEIR